MPIFREAAPVHGLGEHGHWTLPFLGTDLSTYRVLLLFGVLFTIPGMVLTWFCLRDGVRYDSDSPLIPDAIAA